MLYPRPFNIVCTSDGFVGKAGLMRALGCIPTRKFQPDTALVRDMLYAVKKLKSSILLYPEASYSFDGTATPLPESLGKCVKALGVPVVLLRTCGAFARDPLYNGLQNRRVNVSAELRYLLSPEEAAEKSADEINALLADEFSFDNFRWQQENSVVVNEPFRADGLNRVLYKCPHCGTEGETEGRGTELICRDCGVRYRLTELGALECENAEAKFTHVPDWYAWERACVREELEQGSYLLDAPVSICVMVNFRQICRVGEGRLRHDTNGFRLTGCGGKLDFTQKPETSYSLYADYFWYELGDIDLHRRPRRALLLLPAGEWRCGRQDAARRRGALQAQTRRKGREKRLMQPSVAQIPRAFLACHRRMRYDEDRKQKGERR